MKKYFMKGTEDELQFGDPISVVLTKETEDGHTKHKRIDCKFVPEFLDLLLEEGIIEEQEVEDTEIPDDVEFADDEPCDALEDLLEDFETLEERVEKIEGRIDKLIDTHKDFVRLTSEMLDTFKVFVMGLSEKKETAQPKKK